MVNLGCRGPDWEGIGQGGRGKRGDWDGRKAGGGGRGKKPMG